MPDERFAATFDRLRAMLLRHGKRLNVVTDLPGDFQLASSTQQDRAGRLLFIAGVHIKKNYVSFHLIPVYVCPELLDGVSDGLRASGCRASRASTSRASSLKSCRSCQR